MRASKGTPSASSVSAACFMVAQSDWLPMISPTAGFRAGGRLVVLAIRLSGDDVGDELAFQLCNLVLEPKLALFQPLQLELVDRLLEQPVDHLVEVTMLAPQGFELGLDRLDVQRVGVVAHQRRAVYPFGRPKGSMSDFLPHPFWNFSLEIYSGAGVAEACLDLQDRRGCDVNVLLFCCWLGASGRPPLTADRLRAILKVSDVWQAEIVRPLRQVRQLLKDKPWLEAL